MNKLSLKACRINADLTQADVARIMKTAISTVQNWETGKTSPTMIQGLKLCELYKVDVNFVDFFYNEN